MKKSNILVCLLIASLLFLIIYGVFKEKTFEIYLIEDNCDNFSEKIKNVELPLEPLISIDDIVAYNWDNHEMVLTEETWKRIDKEYEMNLTSKLGLIFIAALDREPVYYGSSNSGPLSVKSSCPITVSIIMVSGIMKAKIFSFGGIKDYDILNNQEIYDVLNAHDKIVDSRAEWPFSDYIIDLYNKSKSNAK